ncbi:MAG: hypothetical protein FWC46_04260 [Actinomycetia bacterium]|nr:hypothetical protein [Actinomycetes bacterium]
MARTCIIRSLAPLVFEAVDLGDDVATRVVERQADEIVACPTAALRRLGVLGQPCPVVLGGGVIAPRYACLLQAVDRLLAERAPGAHAVIVTDPPLVGAALMGFDALEAAPDVPERVRVGLRRRASAL